jgi:hypothetical protein
MPFELQSENLLLTASGRAWLGRFAEANRPMVRQLTEALLLVSLQEFERTLQRTIETFANDCSEPVALYSAREVPSNSNLSFRNGGNGLDSVAAGSDVGSEARVAHFVRQLCRTQSNQLLRQPSIEKLLNSRVRHIVVVDDLIGSGGRIYNYLTQLWNDSTIKSWWSYKLISFTVVAYAGTAEGVRHVRQHPCKPNVEIHRYCPTLNGLPWPLERRRQARRLCLNYFDANVLKGWPLGFGDSAALLVFEHGCPNNVPGIFWANSKNSTNGWQPLFPGRASSADVASVFPPELKSRTPISVLLTAGQPRVAGALSEVVDRPLRSEIVVLLALLGRGIKRVDAIAHATGLEVKACEVLLETCIAAGFVSPRRRLTDVGAAELAGIRDATPPRINRILKLGEDSYYPRSLRGRIVG